jgi:hypothetical protein
MANRFLCSIHGISLEDSSPLVNQEMSSFMAVKVRRTARQWFRPPARKIQSKSLHHSSRNCSIIIPLRSPRPSQYPLKFRIHHQILLRIPGTPNRATEPAFHISWFDYTNISGKAKIILIKEFSPASCNFLCLSCSNILLAAYFRTSWAKSALYRDLYIDGMGKTNYRRVHGMSKASGTWSQFYHKISRHILQECQHPETPIKTKSYAR